MVLFPLAANKTQIENNPFIQVKFREKVDEKRLYEAVRQALSDHPLFACTLRYDKKFYLEQEYPKVEIYTRECAYSYSNGVLYIQEFISNEMFEGYRDAVLVRVEK